MLAGTSVSFRNKASVQLYQFVNTVVSSYIQEQEKHAKHIPYVITTLKKVSYCKLLASETPAVTLSRWDDEKIAVLVASKRFKMEYQQCVNTTWKPGWIASSA